MLAKLDLDEVQHGIAIMSDPSAVKEIKDRKIVFNVCPSSNIKLGIVHSYKLHPIGQMYRAGLAVTINTDDLLVFDETLSQQYLSLYSSGVLTAEELDCIRKLSLRS